MQEIHFRLTFVSQKRVGSTPVRACLHGVGDPGLVGLVFFCFHALEDTKQKKPTPLDRGPPLHVNRVLVSLAAVFWMSRNAPRKERERCVTSKKRLRGRLDSCWQYSDFFLRTACVMDMTEELKIFLMS